MLTIPAENRQTTVVVAGVDTHRDTHHVAVLDLQGRLLADHEFPTGVAGYQQLLDWVGGFGLINGVGVELTGSYGAGLTRHLLAAGIPVYEVNTTHKQVRSRRGKDDRIDAEQAARKLLAGAATAIPKDTTGAIESVRMLMVVHDSAVKSRTLAINQFKSLLITAPDTLRSQFSGLTTQRQTSKAFALRPTGTLSDPVQAGKRALQRLAARIRNLDAEIRDADKELAALVKTTAPTLAGVFGVGPHNAATLLVAAGQNIDRITSSAKFARFAGVAPVPISSGQTNRMRLHRGGDRQANRALYMITITRLAHDPRTRTYQERRANEQLSKRDIIRCLKRHISREIYKALKTDLSPLDKT